MKDYPKQYWEGEEPEYIQETADYRSGSIVIYDAPKARKKKPKYGYKFVDTDKPK